MEPIGYNKDKASKVLEKLGIDVLVASTPVSVFYASGIPTLHVAPNPILYVLSNQFPTLALIRSDGEEALVNWISYQSTSKFSWITDTIGIPSPKAAIENVRAKIEQWGFSEGRIGIESLAPRYQADFLREKFPSATFVDADQAFLEMRLVKTEEEIARIRKSTEISEAAISTMIDAVAESMTDFDLLQIARRAVVDRGAEGWDHLTLGIGTSDPEAPGAGTVVNRGDICRFDIGTVWQGYISDVSRHVVIGDPPEGSTAAIDRMIQLQEFTVDNIKPGVNTKELSKQVKEFGKTLMEKKGSSYVTVHSLGLEVEECHLLSPMKTMDIAFEENMVMDVEVWEPFRVEGGMSLLGVEDCYRVTTNGCERLSSLDKHITIKS
jgi:Xaa-Pro dipeptidase